MNSKYEIKLSKEELISQQNKVDLRLIKTIILALIFIPLLVKVKLIDFIGPKITNSLLDTGVKGEMFTYYKYIFLITFTVILIVLFVYKILSSEYQIVSSYVNIPLLVLFAAIIFSLLFSEYSYIALHGHFERHEGTITFISYLMLFFIASNIKWNVKWANYVMYALYPLVIVNVTLSLFYFYGYNVLNTSFVKKVVAPLGDSSAQADIGGFISSTFYHNNYLSGIAAVLTVLFLAKAITDKHSLKKLINILFSLLSYTMVITSLSSSGFVTLVLVMPLLVAAIFTIQHKIKGVITLLLTVIGFVIIFIPVNNHNPNVWNESVGFFIKSQNTQPQPVETMGVKQFAESFLPGETVFADDKEKMFSEFELPEKGVGAGSGRLYIWDKTIELMKERPILGYGLDTLPYYFPQNDPQIYANIESYEIIIDKSHNMYISLAYGSGIIALLAFLTLIIQHAIENIRFIRMTQNKEVRAIVVPLFLAWIAYLIQGVFNETFIGTAPIFWIIFGVSVSIINGFKEKTA